MKVAGPAESHAFRKARIIPPGISPHKALEMAPSGSNKDGAEAGFCEHGHGALWPQGWVVDWDTNKLLALTRRWEVWALVVCLRAARFSDIGAQRFPGDPESRPGLSVRVTQPGRRGLCGRPPPHYLSEVSRQPGP